MNKLICDTARLEEKDVEVSWEEVESFEYIKNEFGEPLMKKDFVRVNGNAHNMLLKMKNYLVQFRQHHDLVKWQDNDWQLLKTDFSRGTFVSIQDFSKNIHHRVRFEQQSKYYTQVSST
eukprot:6172115-Pleurochrysis_carterae.AAC.2